MIFQQYVHQLRKAQEEVARMEQGLRASGYVNTIHDCWEPMPEPKVDSHKLGFCIRYACGQTCIGCGDPENGQDLPENNADLS